VRIVNAHEALQGQSSAWLSGLQAGNPYRTGVALCMDNSRTLTWLNRPESQRQAVTLHQFFNKWKEIMRNLYRFGWLAASLLISFASYARDIEVSVGWIRATAPGQDQGGADLSIISKQSATLVGASSPVCKVVQLHTMTSEGGMMRMREVKAIELPAGKRVNLRESGYHLMLIGLKVPLKEGDTVPLTLSIKVGKQGVMKVETTAEVKSLTATEATSHDDEHMQMHMKMQ
jgi:periplasmic copper chaperone A